MKIKTCMICGKKFESHNGLLVCGEECRAKRKRQQDKEGNYRRYHGLSKIPKLKKCPICGKEFEAFHNMKYCGKDCYMVAQKRKSNENFALYYSDPEWKKMHQYNRTKNKGD